MLYSIDEFNIEKKKVAGKLILDQPTICSQNISEFANVCLRRWKYPKLRVAYLVNVFLERCNYIPLSTKIYTAASKVMYKYDFQYFDALIISAALSANCEILYSEDMHHGLLVENQLHIINPFLI